MREEASRLVRQADRDLENADANIGIRAYEVAAFLSEQAVEKYLKAMFIEVNRAPAPKSHDLMQLGRGLGAPEPTLKDLAYLTPDYTVSRYPNAANAVPYEIYDEETARSKVRAAQRVIEWLRSLIQR
ncbi:MAG: HEPN domain-containing protein [Dehalococcoidia bacterium]